MTISSPAFTQNAGIPLQYSCKGQDTNPPLIISDTPRAAKSLVLVMHDPDAPAGDWPHWVVWNINPMTTSVPAGSTPMGAVQGLNGANEIGYQGPCPPSGMHHYVFDLYALDITLPLASGSSHQQVLQAMGGHVLAQAQLVGVVATE